jgi:hypothetical protein
MSEGVTPVRAWLTSQDIAPGAIVATNPSARTNSVWIITVAAGPYRRGTMVGGTSPVLPTARDEHMIGDLDSSGTAALRICDVIVQSYPTDAQSPLIAPDVRLARILARYPGCAVAAVSSADDHFVGLRDGGVICFAGRSSHWAADGLGEDNSHNDPRTNVTAVCASLVHVWMVSGRRLDALDSTTVVTTTGLRSEMFMVHVPD